MIAIENLTLRIGGLTLLEDASALVPEGRRVGLIGRNGAGKSTLLDAILGRIAPDRGSISMPKRARVVVIDGANPADPAKRVLHESAERHS